MNKKIIFILLIILVLFFGCTQSINNEDITNNQSNTNLVQNASGGEKLISVKAEYSFCYSTDNPDPTLRQQCEENITYKQCKEWQLKENGASNTFFYATFSGGEVTEAAKKMARYSNEYYMKVYYDEKEIQSGKRAVFKDSPSDFMEYAEGGCYPTANIEIYRQEGNLLVGKMSIDNTNN